MDEPLLKYFRPPSPDTLVGQFSQLAHTVVDMAPRNEQRTQCLRHLLDALDAAQRAFFEVEAFNE
jgi:hypothetical protein